MPVPVPASLLRRLGAMFYDSMLLVAVFLIGTALFLPFTHGEAIGGALLRGLHRLTLLALTTGFYGLFWTRSGQTLGMAAWRLRIEREDGGRLTWRDTVVRLAAATLSLLALGIGFLWILFDPDDLAWHDRLSRTRVVLVPKRK
ncbi:MAG TPA: RDD family protein [Steroidobacteraceae bacterium]|nr:RDD family protein [Steroidobacteraceae bacterium]